jgi:hypothetical protein
MNYFTSDIPIGYWVNLSIDLLSFINYLFKDLTFKSIDNITISSNCKYSS